MKRKNSAEITVVFALISTVIIGLLLTIMESARTDGARLKTTIAANSSVDSLFSQYHRTLWKDYRLLGLEQYAYEQLKDEMTEFMQPYMDAKNWYPMQVDTIDLNEVRCLTDENGAVFEEDAVEYMKDSLMIESIKESTLSGFDFSLGEAASVVSIAKMYSQYTKDAVKLEKKVTKIQKAVVRQKEAYEKARRRLEDYDGEGFIQSARDTIRALESIKTCVSEYNAKADQLEGKVRTSRNQLDGEHDSGVLSDSVWSGLDGEVKDYESYAYEEGARRTEISELAVRADRDIALLENLITETEETMEYIEEWEEEHEDDDSDDDDGGPGDGDGEGIYGVDWGDAGSDDDDELDLEEVWEPVIEHLHQYDLITEGPRGGIANEELEAQLEGVQELVSGDVLQLILPQGARVSKQELDLTECPSHSYLNSGKIELNVLKRGAVSEYIAAHLNYFGRGIYDKREQKGNGGCEIEYTLYGFSTDHANLSAAAAELIALRSGLNLIYLFTDKVKMKEAKDLGLLISGAVAMPALAVLIMFLILTVWAMAQAVMDVRELLKGNKVPFMHTKKTFTLSLQGMMNLSGSGIATGAATAAAAAGTAGTAGGAAEGGSSSGKGSGMDYFGYLRLLLFTHMGSGVDYRCMDMIQMNIRRTQPDFRMDRLVYSLRATVNVKAAHLFTNFGFVRSLVDVPETFYIIPVDTSYSY